MLTLYAARIEDLGQGDFVRIDCAACYHVALLMPEALLRLGLSVPWVVPSTFRSDDGEGL